MLDPYRMIVVNIVASLVLGASILIYRFVYPKKKINLFYLLLLIMLLPLISILRKGSYQSGDLSLHAKYAMQFFDNITQGNLVPQWIGNHCHTYGCPEYIFIFFLPYYIISLLHFLGFSFLAGVKILLILSFFLSGIGMFKWIKEELGERSAFVASIFYLFSPYHLIDLHFRVSIGEVVSFGILPFIFLSIKRFVEKNSAAYFLANSTLFALLILAHNATALVSLPFVFMYSLLVWLRNKKRKYTTMLLVILSFTFSVLLTSFYWLPLLAESKYIFYGNQANIDFHPFKEFFYSPHRFGLLFQGHMGELYLNVGYAQWFVLIAALLLLFRKKVKGNEKILLFFSILSFLLLFVMMQSFSKPAWDIFPFAKSIQFSWRLLIQLSIFTSIIAGIVVKQIKSTKIIVLLCLFAIFYTILNWGNRKSEPAINDHVLRNEYVFTDTSSYELTTPIWIDLSSEQATSIPKNHIEVLSGNAEIKQLSRVQTIHIYQINVRKNALIKENTYYFPGWKLFIDGKEAPITYQSKPYKGVIKFNLEKGDHNIKLIFTYTPISLLGQKISVLSGLIFVAIALLLVLKRLKIKQITSKTKD